MGRGYNPTVFGVSAILFRIIEVLDCEDGVMSCYLANQLFSHVSILSRVRILGFGCERKCSAFSLCVGANTTCYRLGNPIYL
jgi:hypothetical protein